jgi:hypothetical protein
MWWNFSITALESFLINDFLSENVPRGARGISILSSFCGHVFLLNSLAWLGKKPLLGVVDLGSVWSSWAPGHLALGEAAKEPKASPSEPRAMQRPVPSTTVLCYATPATSGCAVKESAAQSTPAHETTRVLNSLYLV